MRGDFQKIISLFLLGIEFASPSFADDKSGNRIPKKAPLESSVLGIPEPPRFPIPSYRCADYATRAAENIYGKNYVPANAWDLRENNKIIFPVEKPEQLLFLVKEDILKPGMIVGTYNPPSKYNRKGRKYTHVVLYVGENSDGELRFIHQWGSKLENISLSELLGKGLTPIEILDTPN